MKLNNQHKKQHQLSAACFISESIDSTHDFPLSLIHELNENLNKDSYSVTKIQTKQQKKLQKYRYLTTDHKINAAKFFTSTGINIQAYNQQTMDTIKNTVKFIHYFTDV